MADLVQQENNMVTFDSYSTSEEYDLLKIFGFNFFNLKNGISEQCTRFDLKTKYNLDKDCITRLVKGEYKSHKGWIIKD